MCIAQYTPFIFSQAYHIVRPSKAPGFSYAWLELISHRVFIAKLLLQTTQQKVQRIVFITAAWFWYIYPSLYISCTCTIEALLFKATECGLYCIFQPRGNPCIVTRWIYRYSPVNIQGNSQIFNSIVQVSWTMPTQGVYRKYTREYSNNTSGFALGIIRILPCVFRIHPG